MTNFYNLNVKEIKRETIDTVSVAFDIPNDLKSTFQYKAGQYVTLKLNIDGEELRRSYSLCSSPVTDNEFRIAVKKVKDGRISGYINDKLKEGDSIALMPPAGNFTTNLSIPKHLIAFAAGSGITPVISILKTTLAENPNSLFTLFYGNRTTTSTIFKAELDDLCAKYGNRLTVLHLLDEESTGNPLTTGMMDRAKTIQLLDTIKSNLEKEYFICGPEQMIITISNLLKEKETPKENIHFELFTTPTKIENNTPVQVVGAFKGISLVKVKMDDEEFSFELNTDGNSILDAAMDAGVDAPFSCKGAVCCTCKAKVIEGSAVMEMNYALSDSEVEEGFILTCQAHPSSEKLIIDYDVI